METTSVLSLVVSQLSIYDQGQYLYLLRQTCSEFAAAIHQFVQQRWQYYEGIPSTIRVGRKPFTYLYRHSSNSEQVEIYRVNFLLDQIFHRGRISLNPQLIPPLE